MCSRPLGVLVVALAFLAIVPVPGRAQGQTTGYDQSLFKEMKWRLIGPFRGGRALAVTGVAGEPDVFYFGAVAGGVWRSADGGATWLPFWEGKATKK